MKLKDLKYTLISNVIVATIEDNGEENYLYTTDNFDIDNVDAPADLWEREVDYIYAWHDKELNKSYTMVWLKGI